MTLYLVLQRRRSNEVWEGAAEFAVSIFVLLFIARVPDVVPLWPLVGVALAAALALSSSRRPAEGRRAPPLTPTVDRVRELGRATRYPGGVTPLAYSDDDRSD